MKKSPFKWMLAIILMSTTLPVSAQKYEANWSSLDSRPNPEWYLDAKFGIFIHWGVYSVPAWRPKGSYAEWYWKSLIDRHDSTWIYHNKWFGENFKYQDFAPQFKAELFEPDKWAELFKNAGARYVVLTSKHHDGYALWPSRQSWNWNSMDIGPHRDLLGDLTEAVRAQDIKMGFYYSLYEWYNPLYNSDVDRYVDEHVLPQFKDAVQRYKPSIIFSDGEWDHPSKTWRSEEFLAWLYNESNAPEDVVVNDRWGGETRFRHGGYYSTEYENVNNEISQDLIERGWEECRGIGASFGYNRNEDISDYQTGESLVHMLIEIVSKGGNLLLNVGPTGDGRIPVIMQERLRQIGAWLAINGEAIYATRANRIFSQGKHIRFTRSKDGEYLYAILLKRPSQKMLFNQVEARDGSEVMILGTDQKLTWQNRNGHLEVEIPDEVRDNLPGDFAWTLKIAARPHVARPEIVTKSRISVDAPMRITLRTATPDADIHYSIDGSEPTQQSPQFNNEIVLPQSAALRARAFKSGLTASLIAEASLSVVDSKKHGLHYRYYEGVYDSLPEFSASKPVSSGQTFDFGIEKIIRQTDHFALIFTGDLDIARKGDYTFYLTSDDGSKLLIDGKVVVDHDGLHGRQEKSGTVALSTGRHAIDVQFFERGGSEYLDVKMEGPGMHKQSIPPAMLLRKK